MERPSPHAYHDVILNSGEAGVRDRTGPSNPDGVDGNVIDVCSWVDPIYCIGTA
jgi:hypothetical protein